MNGVKEYVAYVSLGYYCGVAASLEKYGLRSFSGPFDWVFSDFQGILRLLENDFSDFLCRDNLTVEGNKFFDTKYGLEFPHEVKHDFEEEYQEIVERYQRRISYFRQKVKEGVCFLRAIEVEEELQWIISNEKRIETIIKQGNSKNEIKYLLPAYLDAEGKLQGKVIQLPIQQYVGSTPQELRGLFEGADDVVEQLIANMNPLIYKDNLIFSLNKWVKKRDEWIAKLKKSSEKQSQQLEKTEHQLQVLEEENKKLSHKNAGSEFKYKALASIHSTKFAYNKFPKRVDIFGADYVGKILCDTIRPFCRVGCFIDNLASVTEYQGVPVKKAEEYEAAAVATLVVTSPHDYEAIVSMLQKKCGVEKERILSLKAFLARVKQTETSQPSYRGKRKKNNGNGQW